MSCVKRFQSLVALAIKQLQVGRGLIWELSVVCAVVVLVLSARQQMVSGFMPSVPRYQILTFFIVMVVVLHAEFAWLKSCLELIFQICLFSG